MTAGTQTRRDGWICRTFTAAQLSVSLGSSGAAALSASFSLQGTGGGGNYRSPVLLVSTAAS